MLTRLQKGLETLYRIDTRVSVDDFVIDDEARQRLGVRRAPREQLFIDEAGDDVDGHVLYEVMHYMTHYPDAFHHPREDMV